jgi:hypothetical protein
LKEEEKLFNFLFKFNYNRKIENNKLIEENKIVLEKNDRNENKLNEIKLK